ncbi:MAG: hypothetical protein GTN80_03455 [Nitrososphaeria archaeon]|nr:hypothetical protein [Nitrososphaeria archaeon]NIN52232.1 hypothetical protein [Nitrososphaeria archaeon]NIQ32688.1 hypothetical protein [Nitrososphaeria archaeon]
MKKKIISTEWAKPWLSLGIKAGPFLFTSGIMPRNYSTGEIVGGDIKAQTRPARSSCICDLAIPEAKIEMEVVALIP